jgi:hypothetical protein
MDSGCYVFWCFPCFMCRLHARTSECPCMWCCPGGKYQKKVGLLLLLLFIANTALRTKIRTGFRIRASA